MMQFSPQDHHEAYFIIWQQLLKPDLPNAKRFYK